MIENSLELRSAVNDAPVIDDANSTEGAVTEDTDVAAGKLKNSRKVSGLSSGGLAAPIELGGRFGKGR